MIRPWWLLRLSCALVGLIGLSGCVHIPPAARPEQIRELQQALVAMHPEVQEGEAQAVATLAYEHPRELAREYRLWRPPWWHNLLINLHLKQRGLCYQWAEDMVAKLETLELTSLELRWGVARGGSVREHNTVVVTARGQSFAEGMVLDPWRRSGALVWKLVRQDSYPWQEGVLMLPPAPPTSSAATP